MTNSARHSWKSALRADASDSIRDLREIAIAARDRWRTVHRIPPVPAEATVDLDATSEVILQLSSSPRGFSPQTYARESAFANELAARGRSFAVTTQPELVFGKSVVWFLPESFIGPRLWNYSRQAFEFALGLERQGNAAFYSASETAFWENKVHMHERLSALGAPTPVTRILTRETWEADPFDIEPVLIKEEHSSSSAGIYHFSTGREARQYVETYAFAPEESLIMQALVEGATRDLRLTMVGSRAIPSATYWRTKSKDALARAEWTTTATSYDSLVEHIEPPASLVARIARMMDQLGIRTAGVDLMWPGDDLTADPLILELSPHYQPNPPKPARYSHLSYKQFKADWTLPEGYPVAQYRVFREIAAEILDQGLVGAS